MFYFFASILCKIQAKNEVCKLISTVFFIPGKLEVTGKVVKIRVVSQFEKFLTFKKLIE